MSTIDMALYQALARIKSPKFKIRTEKKLVVLGDSELTAIKGGGYTESDDEDDLDGLKRVVGSGAIQSVII